MIDEAVDDHRDAEGLENANPDVNREGAIRKNGDSIEHDAHQSGDKSQLDRTFGVGLRK